MAQEQPVTESKKISMKTNRTLASSGVMICSLLFLVFGSEETVFWLPSPDPVLFSIYHLSLICLWGGAWNGVAYYRKLYVKRNEMKAPLLTRGGEARPYQLEVPLLLDRSDSLDAMQGSLRTGTTVLLGFAAAALAWLSTSAVLPWVSQSLLWVAVVVLAFMTGMAILFSYTDFSLRISDVRMKDGLLPPPGCTQEAYVCRLILFIQEKENTLVKMRKVVGLGLLLFLMISTVSFLIIPYSVLPNAEEASTVNAIGMMLWLFSFFSMAGFLFSFAAYVVGKPVLGIVESDELRSYFEWMKDDRSGRARARGTIEP